MSQAITMQQKQAGDLQSSTSRLTTQMQQQVGQLHFHRFVYIHFITNSKAETIADCQRNIEDRKKFVEEGAREYGTMKTRRDELTNARNQVGMTRV